jgi:hypothetical protein
MYFSRVEFPLPAIVIWWAGAARRSLEGDERQVFSMEVVANKEFSMRRAAAVFLEYLEESAVLLILLFAVERYSAPDPFCFRL